MLLVRQLREVSEKVRDLPKLFSLAFIAFSVCIVAPCPVPLMEGNREMMLFGASLRKRSIKNG